MGETITNEHTAARRPAGPDRAIKALTLPDAIGYIALPTFWSVETIADQLDAAFLALADTRGLIIDLRANGGGDAATASLLASLLFDTEPAHRIEVYRPWSACTQQSTEVYAVRYHKPVAVLVGRRSSAAAWRFARNLAAMGRVVLAGALPAIAHGFGKDVIDMAVPESTALRRAQERLASS